MMETVAVSTVKAKPHIQWEPGGLKHQRLRTELLAQIATGRFRPGDILPGEHQLAEMMQVSRTTVRQTLGDLEREGLVKRVQGKGTFVSDRPQAEAGKRTSSLALIVPDVATGYYPSLVSGFDHAASEAGHPIVVCNTHNEIDKQASQIMRLIDQGVAGILLNPSTRAVTPAFQVRLAQKSGIPVVLLHRGVPDVQAPVLELPAQEVGRRAGRLFVEAGHRQVGYLASHRYAASEAFENGLREVVAEAGGELAGQHVDYGDMQQFGAGDYQAYETYLEERLREILTGPQRPTALFVSYDTTAEMVYLIAQRMGLRVPDDLSIVCFGGAERKGAIVRRLTAVTVDEADTAHQAVQLLVQMQQGQHPITHSLVIPMSLGLSQGQTLGAVAASA
jgi:GntR family transcriptional regulator of arabinose operon